MTNLENFLNKKQPDINNYLDPVDGSFQCQDKKCTVITYEAFLSSDRKTIVWTCANGHDSSVTI
jgi:hypothetical protein